MSTFQVEAAVRNVGQPRPTAAIAPLGEGGPSGPRWEPGDAGKPSREWGWFQDSEVGLEL